MEKLHCLLINLGSPSSFEKKSVASYLRHFLMDRYVLRMPYLLRAMLVNLVIVPRRAAHSAELYAKVWSEGRSPLVLNSEKLVEKIKAKLEDKFCSVGVSFAMRHGTHLIREKFEELAAGGIEKLMVVPMFPQYEGSTYLSVVEEVNKCSKRCGIDVLFVPPFFNHGDYLSALERSVREGLNGKLVDKLVFSYHGVPLSYLPCGEKQAVECGKESVCDVDRTRHCKSCYKYQCYATTEAVCESISATSDDYIIVFQSRLGRNEWLKPSLNDKLKSVVFEGVESVAVVAPSFTADCLETLYEIDVEARECFLKAGGKEFYYIAALNDLDLWAKKLSKWIIEFKKDNKSLLSGKKMNSSHNLLNNT